MRLLRNAPTRGSRSMITGHAGTGATRGGARMRRPGWRYRRGRALARGRRLPGGRTGALARAPRRAGERAALALRPSTAAPRRTLPLVGALLRDRLRLRGAGGGDPRAHYLHTVLERGAGVPIACSAIWIAVGARAEIPVEGVNLPGPFRRPRRRASLRHRRERRAARRGGRQAPGDDGHRQGDRASRAGADGPRQRPGHARAHVAQPARAATRASNAGTRPCAPPTAASTSCRRRRSGATAGCCCGGWAGSSPRSTTSPRTSTRRRRTCPDRTPMTEVAGRLRAFLN